MSARLTFHGGAGSVTGANFLLDTGTAKILIDCGTNEQEHPPAGGCNPEDVQAFPYEPATMATLLVTHAHQDHIGRIPKLVRDGFRGPIHSTKATRDLAHVMLDDALSVLQEEAEEQGCALLYERKDIEQAMHVWETHEYHEPFSIGDVEVEFSDAGHVLGSALITISRGGRSILFTLYIINNP